MGAPSNLFSASLTTSTACCLLISRNVVLSGSKLPMRLVVTWLYNLWHENRTSTLVYNMSTVLAGTMLNMVSMSKSVRAFDSDYIRMCKS